MARRTFAASWEKTSCASPGMYGSRREHDAIIESYLARVISTVGRLRAESGHSVKWASRTAWCHERNFPRARPDSRPRSRGRPLGRGTHDERIALHFAKGNVATFAGGSHRQFDGAPAHLHAIGAHGSQPDAAMGGQRYVAI